MFELRYALVLEPGLVMPIVLVVVVFGINEKILDKFFVQLVV